MRKRKSDTQASASIPAHPERASVVHVAAPRNDDIGGESAIGNADGADDDEQLRTSEVCAWLKISRDTLLRWRRDPDFPEGFRIAPGSPLRFSKHRIRAFMARRQQRFAGLRHE